MATVNGNGTSAVVSFGPAWNGGTLCVTANTPCFTSAQRCLSLTTSTPAPGAITGTSSVCPASTITYSVPAVAGAALYNWTLPLNATGSSSSNSIVVTFGSSFTSGDVKVTMTSICGNLSSPRIKTITVGTPAVPLSISGQAAGLCGQSTVYSCPSVNGATSYTWTLPGGATINSGQGSTAINASFTSFSTGNICVTANNGCGGGSPRCVSLKGAPSLPSSVIINPSAICANQSGIDLQVAPVFGTTTYNWSFPAGVASVLNLGNEQIVDWGPVGGTVAVTVSNACGNATKTQNVALNCRQIESAVDQIEKKMSIYPNPATNILHLEFENAAKENISFQLIDISGRMVMESITDASKGFNHKTIDLSPFSKGVYTLLVKTSQENKMVRVLIE